MDAASGVGAFVPLFQTGLWVVLIAGTGIALRKQIGPILRAVRQRIEHGSALKVGPIEVGEDLEELDLVRPAAPNAQLAPVPPGGIDWAAERQHLYDDARHIFLAHVIEPSQDPGQEYDVYIYLKPHKGHSLSEVESAEFFFGHYWGTEVFGEIPKGEVCGVRTSAYGPFVCTCRVHFRDGYVSFQSRYIDFEMGRVWRASATSLTELRATPLPRPRRAKRVDG